MTKAGFVAVKTKDTTWINALANALFAWLIRHIFLVNEQYFSLTINQSTVLSVMAYQPNEQGITP